MLETSIKGELDEYIDCYLGFSMQDLPKENDSRARMFLNNPNSLEYTGVPFLAPEDGRQQEEVVFKYLNTKFWTFNQLVDGEVNVETILKYISDDWGLQITEIPNVHQGAKSLLENFNKLSSLEEVVYLQRCSDLAAEIVHEKYYNETEEYKIWSSRLIEDHYVRLQQLSMVELIEEYNRLVHQTKDAAYEEIDFSTRNSLRICTENLLSMFSSTYNYISEKIVNLDILDQNEIYKIVPDIRNKSIVLPSDTVVKVNRFIHSLLNQISENIGKGNYQNRERLENIVVRLLEEHYDCEFVDYLKVEGDSLHVIAISKDSVTTEDLGVRERYGAMEGITGAVLLQQSSSEKSFVGTNNIKQDLRISPAHKTRYEEAHDNKLRNYWIFPVYDDANLFSAIRVVNKLTGTRVWSYKERIELAALTKALTPILLEKRRIYEIDDTELGLSPVAIRNAINQEWGFKVEHKFIADVTAFILSVVHKKIEKKSLGVTVAIAKDTAYEKLSHILSAYPIVGVDSSVYLEPSELGKYLNYVEPDSAFFMFDTEGKFIGCFAIPNQSVEPNDHSANLLKISHTLNDDVLFLQVKRNSSIVRGVRNGKIMGDIYLQEDRGYWARREYKELYQSVVKTIVDSDDIQLLAVVFNMVWSLALKKTGAIVAITCTTLSEDNIDKSEVSPNSLSILSISENLFVDLCTIDGATLIDRNANIYKAGVIVTGAKDNSESFDNGDTKSRTFSAGDKSIGGGARHGAGQRLSAVSDGSYVFVVSENGGISYFFGGTAIFFKR